MTATKKELEREIARLYKQGQSHIEYNPTNAAMTLMMLYINKKFDIQCADPLEIDQIRQYGRCTTRQKKMKSCKPARYAYELYLYFDKKDRLTGSNKDEYYGVVLYKLTQMIEANPGKKIFYPFEIAFVKEDEPMVGHVEVIVYDPATNTLEHIDPNQLPKQCWRQNREYFACRQISEEVVARVAEDLECKPRYINNNDIYTGYECGIQSLESASDKIEGTEKKGYCLMWTSLLADLALTFPECSLKDIIRTMLNKAASKHTKVDCLNDYFLYMIRGYVLEISRELDVSFMDTTTAYDACVRLATNS